MLETDRETFHLDSKRRPSEVQDGQRVAHFPSRVTAPTGVAIPELTIVILAPALHLSRHRDGAGGLR